MDAPFAVSANNSKGRKYPQKPHPYRSDFERDRDRIIHCSAFRRLEGKTQVFTLHINDHYRTRLTHSIEVAQIGRTIATAVGVNQPLTEAVCLGHDLGHSPFGHSGENALNKIMAKYGGFEHNSQTLRIVETLERPYPEFAGLNLMYETLLSLAKHRTVYDEPLQTTFAEKNCPLEGQIADIADRIAYNCHDLEDGLRAKLLDYNSIMNLVLCKEASQKCQAEKIGDSFTRNTRIAKTAIDILVGDCIKTSKKKIRSENISSLEDVYKAAGSLICISRSAEEAIGELEKFLHKNMYEHPQIKAVSAKAGERLEKVFDKFLKQPVLLPKFYQNLIDECGLRRAVCDYVSGMTDWYCLSKLGGKNSIA